MSDRPVDVSRWNLFVSASLAVPVALIAACGPVLAQEDGPGTNRDSDPTDATDPTDPTDPSATSSSETSNPECESNSDCDYGYSCNFGYCEYDCFCGCGIAPPPPGFESRCSPPLDCYSDDECSDGEVCRYGYCEPDVLDCNEIPMPVVEASLDLAFSGDEGVIVALAAADVAPSGGIEVIAARGTNVEVFVDGQGAVVATAQAPIVSLVVGDVDGDGQADLVFADENTLAVWLVDGGVATPTANVLTSAGSLALGDVDGDALVDIVGQVGETLVVYAGLGGGNFEDATLLVDGGVESFAIADTDLDGRSDALWTGGGNLSLLAGPGTPLVLGAVASSIAGDVVATDFDGDGIVDVAAIGRSPSAITSLLGPITLTSPFDALFAGDASAASTGDIDGDARPDLVLALGELGTVYVRFGSTPAPVDVGPSEPFGCSVEYDAAMVADLVIAADVDGNGISDLVVSDGSVARVLWLGG